MNLSTILNFVPFQETLHSTLEEYPDLKLFAIGEAICRTGNKQFSLQLSADER
jgi:hypothetical protein